MSPKGYGQGVDDAPSTAPTPTDRNRLGAVRQSTLRSSNLAAVARTVVGTGTPLSRADVASALGVTRSTASRLVDELVSAGVLTEMEARHPSGRGRPGTPLSASPRVGALGLQVNTTFLSARVVSLRGELVAERRISGDFRASRPRPVLRRLNRLGARLLAELDGGIDIVGTGLALPGIVDSPAGVLLVAPNLGWSDLRPGDYVNAGVAPGAAIRLGNEADMAARAVAEVAPGRPGPLKDFIYLSGETGIGAAAVLDGEVMTGRHGWAGEIGHVCVDPLGPQCRCGSTGCLELFAGRQAILAAAALERDTSLREVAALARAGHRQASSAIDRAASALAIALASAVNILDINVVVLGGHLAQIADLVGPRLENDLMNRVLSARWVHPRVEAHGDDDSLGATGAALAQLNRVIDNPGDWISRRRAARTRDPGDLAS
jgi:predicted NBD/HSP70 family sugar kinase